MAALVSLPVQPIRVLHGISDKTFPVVDIKQPENVLSGLY
jgi:hypothetical protein